LNEAVALLGVKPFDGTGRHSMILCIVTMRRPCERQTGTP
jgi:hypothetical protein